MIRWIGGYLRHLPSLCVGMCFLKVYISLGIFLGVFKLQPSNWGGQQEYGQLGRAGSHIVQRDAVMGCLLGT